jgi:hypothetical protein
MSLSEKYAYIKGLIDGGEIKFEGKNQKLFEAFMDILDEIVTKVSDLDEELTGAYESLYLISDRLEEIDEDVDFLFDNDLDDADCCDNLEDIKMYCENCNKTVPVDPHASFLGEAYCPECNEKIVLEEQCECDLECCETE